MKFLKQDIEKLCKEINNINNIEAWNEYSNKILDIPTFYAKSDIPCNRYILIKTFFCKLLIKKAQELQHKYRFEKLGINRLVKKHFYKIDKINKLLPYYNNISTYSGSIPAYFLENVHYSDRKNVSLKIYQLFSCYASKLNFDYEQDVEYQDEIVSKEKDHIELNLIDFEKTLSSLINKKVKMSYVGAGYNGNGFKIEIDNKKYFYKTFYLYNKDELAKNGSHGRLGEPLNAIFLQNNARKSQFTKFYFGKIAYKCYPDSFIVTEFAERNQNYHQDTNQHLDYLSIAETEMHKFDNLINGKIVDYGALQKAIPEFDNKRLRKITRIILQNLNFKKINEYKYSYEMNNTNICVLNNIIKKYSYNDYVKSLNIIKKYINNFTNSLYNKLINIQDVDTKICYINTYTLNKLFVKKLSTLHKQANIFGYHISTTQEPLTMFGQKYGYTHIELPENILLSIEFDAKHVLHKFKIMHKGTNNALKVIFEVVDTQNIQKYKKNINFSKFLKNL